MRPVAPEHEAAPAPVACPFCRSPKIMTAAAKADDSSYWRCEACGQVWNAGRLRPANRQGYGGRWG